MFVGTGEVMERSDTGYDANESVSLRYAMRRTG